MPAYLQFSTDILNKLASLEALRNDVAGISHKASTMENASRTIASNQYRQPGRRGRRKTFLRNIFFNVPEASGNGNNAAPAYGDLESATRFLSIFNGVNTSQLVYRLRTQSNFTDPRPLLVRLLSNGHVLKVLSQQSLLL